MSAIDDLAHLPEWSYPLAGLTESDLQARHGRITASVAAMICNESEFGGPLKAYRILRGMESYRPNESKQLGNIFEPVAGHFHKRRHPKTRLVRPGTRVHPEYSWLAATVDWIGVEGDTAYILEAKYTDESNRYKWGSENTREIPAGYHVQVAIQMAVWSIERAYFAVLIGGTDYREYAVERDLAFERNTIRLLEEFRLNHLLPRIAPQDADRRAYAETVWPAPSLDLRDASDEMETIACAEELRRLAAERARINAEYEAAAGAMCEAIGPNQGVTIGKEKITYKKRANARERVLYVPPSWHTTEEQQHVDAA